MLRSAFCSFVLACSALAGPCVAGEPATPFGLLTPPPLPWGSLYDPHPVPSDRPWLEGYYTRIVDPTWGGSVAVLAGSCSAPGGVSQPGYAALLVQRPGAERLEVYEAFPRQATLLLPGGRVATRPPRVVGDAAFVWSSSRGTLGPRSAELRFAGGASISARFGDPRSWTGRGHDHGPEGLLVRFPGFTQHWFVHSVASRCTYTLRLPRRAPRSGKGWAHQEKNWGSDFPRRWVWAQGLRGAPSDASFAQFALAGGDAALRWGERPDQRLRRQGWLLGVRLGARRLSFRSPGDRFQVRSEPAQGRFVLDALGARRRARVTLQAPIASFAEVSVPSARGFRPGARESFLARGRIEVWERQGAQGAWSPVGEAKLAGAALEFGELPPKAR